MKLEHRRALQFGLCPFSILKRIVMGETNERLLRAAFITAFSILKRIVMGET